MSPPKRRPGRLSEQLPKLKGVKKATPASFTSERARLVGAKTQFKPGQSGNPYGRPKTFSDLIREKTRDLEELAEWLLTLARGHDPDPRAVQRRKKPRPVSLGHMEWAVETILNYTLGRPVNLDVMATVSPPAQQPPSSDAVQRFNPLLLTLLRYVPTDELKRLRDEWAASRGQPRSVIDVPGLRSQNESPASPANEPPFTANVHLHRNGSNGTAAPEAGR